MCQKVDLDQFRPVSQARVRIDAPALRVVYPGKGNHGSLTNSTSPYEGRHIYVGSHPKVARRPQSGPSKQDTPGLLWVQ